MNDTTPILLFLAAIWGMTVVVHMRLIDIHNEMVRHNKVIEQSR